MNILAMTLTRDRLSFTQHCFDTVREFAGCDFDWWVLDNGSTDGTQDWLKHQPDINTILLNENVGIGQGLNRILDAAGPENYDAIIHLDNDLELTQRNTLRDLCELVVKGDAILSPRILGLNNPPQHTRELQIDGEVILDVPQIGGICLTVPAWLHDTYRYPAELPLWGLDDAHICATFRQLGGTCGYVKRLEAWHYLGTNGQRAADVPYFVRKDREYAETQS